VSIVSNGSLVTREWFVEYARWLDIMAVSCDSFVDETNKTQGRALPAAHADKRTQLEIVTAVCGLCREFGVKFKLNSVVTKLSVDEDMSRGIASLCPSLVRWKVFQCLIIDGENAGAEALRDASELVISKAQFDGFVERHRAADPDVAAVLVPEDNDTMRDSYLIVDEYMRFLDNTSNAKVPSESILDVGVAAALARSGFDDDAFHRRGGVYDWSRGPVQPAGAAGAGGAVTACADPALLW
jgi:radical S-adenosyl methionine domain-containing protein 2